jgi:DEAD/DEAH box helicase domain-containing protein
LPDVLATLDGLRRAGWYRGQITHVEPLAERTAEYAEPDPTLFDELRRYLDESGIPQLYSHQVELLSRGRKGENVIVTTGTASGKTLGFNLPVFESLGRDPKTTALYLYPMKAVTQDQLKVLRAMEKTTGTSLRAAVYDGDTPTDKRPLIRRNSRLVLSNPYELHQILPYHYQWQRFFRGLRFVVLDEAHRYRGVFGSNVAQLVRRLRRVARFYGSSPQFILASASIANPEELAGKLTGLEFSHIGKDGAPHGRGLVAFYNPLADPESSVYTQAQRLVAHFASAGLQTICFVQSRRQAELLSRWAREGRPELAVSPYRAGYLAEDRRRIEAALSSGELRGVVSTNALELGIDVGGLDCIIIFGYPGSLASFWQQAGRAGRKLQESLVVFFGMPDALDQYFLRRPELVLDRRFESAVIDIQNPYIRSGHLLCAASELPLRPDEVGENERPLVAALEQQFILRATPAGWVYTGRARPQEEVTLDAIEEHGVEVVVDGRVIETLDRSRACRDAHAGAVLFHQGETYLVKSLDLAAKKAVVERTDVDYYTSVIQREDFELLETLEDRDIVPGCRLAFSKLQVRENYAGYRVKRYDQLLATHPLDLPPVEFKTRGVRLEFTEDFALRLEESGHDFTGGLHGAEHALIAIAPLVAMCDPRDFGGSSYRFFPQNRLPTIFIYDGYEDGIGISEKLFAEFRRWSRTALDLVRNCPCDNGCPACILSPRCGDNNTPMDKAAAISILALVAGATDDRARALRAGSVS